MFETVAEVVVVRRVFPIDSKPGFNGLVRAVEITGAMVSKANTISETGTR